MALISITPRPSYEENPKLAKAAKNLRTLLKAIEEKSIPEKNENQINEIISGVNDFAGPDPQSIKQFKSAQTAILKNIENDLGLVPKNHYQSQWMAIGMAAFGIPMGIAFATSLGNMAFIGIGLPIGIGVGIAIGSSKDKEAADKGKQLDWPPQ